MPRKSRNPLGSIHKHVVLINGDKATVFDVSKRYTDKVGKPRKKFKRCYSKSEALTQLANFNTDVENEDFIPTDDHSFRELVEYYRTEYVKDAVFINGRKVSGFRRNIKHVKKLLDELVAHFGDTPLRSVTYEMLRAYAVAIAQTLTVKDTMPAASTVNEKLSTLRRLFNVAIQMDWLDVNPFTRGKSLIDRGAETKRNRMLTFEEEQRLLLACENRDRVYIYGRHKTNRSKTEYIKHVQREHLIPLIICALDTAMRRSEIFDLEWSQIDLKNRVIYLKDKAAEKTKTGTGGILPMTDRLHDILSQLHESSRDKNVFVRFDYKRAFRSACAEAGIEDLQFRDLRSTGATRMVLAGNAESQVMKVTRHKTLKVFLENYTNVDVANAQRIGTNLSKFIKNSTPKSNQSSKAKKSGPKRAA